MQLELIDLLKNRQICHPAKIQSTEFRDRSGVIHLSGYPWWLEEPDGNNDAEISFQFNEIDEFRIPESWFEGDDFCEDLDDFTIEPMSKTLWTACSDLTVYCSAPLDDKFAILEVVDHFLVTSNCPYELSDFLNMPTIKDFGKITSTSSYQICSGPKPVCEQVVTELERQGVRHSKIEHLTKEDDRLIVRLHGGYMICRSADAVF
ncbi:MAG: hypothetical protein ABJO30_08945 [Hyphomicrobiales bacterium]